MVKIKIFFGVLFLMPWLSNAQWLQLGARINVDFAERITTGQKSYYFATVAPLNATISDIKVKSLPSFEGFVRYDHYDRFFLQAGITGFTNTYDITLTSETSGDPGPDEINAVFAQQYVSIGKLFSGHWAIKPYVTGGLAVTYLLDYSNAHTYSNGSGEWARDEVIVHDLQETFSPVTLLAKVGVGFKFYALHAELTVSKNIAKIDKSDANYYQSWLIPQLSVGYNFITFNTVKKKKH